MERKIDFKMVAKYNGHQIKPSGAVDLNLTCEYSEMTNTIQLLQLLSNDIKLVVKKPNEKPFKLGTFRLQALNYDHDGQAKIRFNSMTDFVEVDDVNRLIPDDKQERFIIRVMAEIEIEEGDEQEDEG